LQVLAGSDLPTPIGQGADIVGEPYVIAPLDKLAIGVFGIEGLEPREVQVDSGGTISFPLAGPMTVAGETPAQVEALLRQRLSAAFVRDPQVTVNLRESVGRIVTVDGQVNRPGAYPVVGRMSLIRAVATAGSTTEFAQLKDVVVFREVGGQRYAALYNLDAIRNGAYPDPQIFSDDVIVVGDSSARRLFRDLVQSAPLLTTPLILLLQN
jgi:polysaccharide export outer membrane protein